MTIEREWPEHPERTALLEAKGALLAWDVLAGDPVPAVRVHDADRAGEWMWEIFGTGDSDDWRVRDAARVVAQLNWAEAWWPASAAAGIPALDPLLLRAERAIATSEVEHLLDDEDAVERALADTAQLPEDHPLAPRLVALAEDYGIVLRETASPSQSEFALAAGGGDQSGDVSVLSGRSVIDWALVPAGVVDAAGEAEWSVVRSQGTTFLDVSVPLVAQAGPRLAARFGQVDVRLDRPDGFGRLTGRVPVPPTVLLLPPAQRVLTVYAPDFAQPGTDHDPDGPARQAAIIAYAQSRLTSPAATFTERAAGRR